MELGLTKVELGLTKVDLSGHSWSVVGGLGWRQNKGEMMMIKNGMGCEYLTSGQQTRNS